MDNKNFFNIDYEKALTACLLLDNSLVEVITGQVSEEFFFDSKYRLIFKTIREIFEEHGVCDILALSTKLPKIPVAEIAELTDCVPNAVNWEFYAKEIKRFYITRQLKSELQSKAAEIGPENVIDIIHELDTSLTSYMDYKGEKPKVSKDLISVLIEQMQENFKNQNLYLGVDTGWENLSEILDGVQYGQLYIIGARPSVGKTAFSVQMISNICKKGIPATFFSLEMTALSLITRLTALKSGIPIPYIRHGWAIKTLSDASKLQRAFEEIYEYPLYIYDKDIANEKDLISKIRIEAKNGCKVFAIDHLGLLACSQDHLKRHEQIGVITKKLHHLAQELNIAIIILCQLNRGAEGKKPTLAELKDSGTIEENADVIMFIHRDRATGTEMEIPAEICVVKNRDGNCGTANMKFLPRFTMFVEDKEHKGIL